MAALVLAGGRSRRLGGIPKYHLRVGDPAAAAPAPCGPATALPASTTLLGVTIAALLDAGVEARRIVVAGPADVLAGSGFEGSGIRVVREDPPFAGPVAGIAAGVEELTGDAARAEDAAPAGLVLTLACDMPGVGAGIRTLMDAASAGSGRSVHADSGEGSRLRGGASSSPGGTRSSPTGALSSTDGAHSPDAWVGVSRGAADGGDDQVQHLLALHRVGPLRAALAAQDTAGMSVRRLLAGLEIARVDLPAGSADDVDTWDDARRFGLGAPPVRREDSVPHSPAESRASAGHRASAVQRISAEPQDAAGEPAGEERR